MSLTPALFAAILSVSPEFPTEAHDIYLHLNDANGASCCNENDCRPVSTVCPRLVCKCTSMTTGLMCRMGLSSTGRFLTIPAKRAEDTGAARPFISKARG